MFHLSYRCNINRNWAFYQHVQLRWYKLCVTFKKSASAECDKVNRNRAVFVCWTCLFLWLQILYTKFFFSPRVIFAWRFCSVSIKFALTELCQKRDKREKQVYTFLNSLTDEGENKTGQILSCIQYCWSIIPHTHKDIYRYQMDDHHH